MNVPEPTCDAFIVDRGRARCCQLSDGHDVSRRHYSALRNGDDIMEWTDDAEFATPASSSPSRPTVTVSEYTVNSLPSEARVADWWHWNVYARRNRAGRWIVTDHDCFFDSDGGRHFTAREAGDHAEADAIALATRVATTMTLMGETAAQAAARILGGAS